jgi:hypothetical protein
MIKNEFVVQTKENTAFFGLSVEILQIQNSRLFLKILLYRIQQLLYNMTVISADLSVMNYEWW